MNQIENQSIMIDEIGILMLGIFSLLEIYFGTVTKIVRHFVTYLKE